MHRKIVAILLAIVTLMSMAACSKQYVPYDYDLSTYVTLGDYKENITYKYSVAEVTEQDVLAQIHADMKEKGYGEEVELKKGVVSSGDTIVMDFDGYIDDKKVDSACATDYSLEIGSNTLIPGFETGLIGKNIGEETTLNLTFPEDYGNEDFNGKPVVFKVTVKSAKHTKYPDLTLEILKEISDEKTIEDYRKSIITALEKENLETAEQQKESDIWSAVVGNAKLVEEGKYPQDAIDEYVKSMTTYYTNVATQNETTLEKYVTDNFGLTLEQFNTTIASMAQQSVFEEMVYNAIARAEGIEVTDAEINTLAKQYAETYGFSTVDAFYESNPKYKVEQSIIYEKVMDLLVKNAKEVK